MEAVPNISVQTLRRMNAFVSAYKQQQPRPQTIVVDCLADVAELLVAAHEYALPCLEGACTNAVIALLLGTPLPSSEGNNDDDDVLRIHNIAVQLLGNQRISACTGHWLCRAGPRVLRREVLLQCSHAAVCSILRLRIHGCTACDFFRAALSWWAARHCGRGMARWRWHRDTLFGCVRFDEMARDELKIFVRHSGVFSLQEYIGILEQRLL